MRDRNVHTLALRLRELGVSLRLVLMVPDEVEAIARAIGLAREAAPVVLTSGASARPTTT